jgi:Predicted nucleic-acid-binding protein, contains PIN domain
MPAEAFLDTTVLIYAVSQNDPRCAIAERILENGGTLSVQVLNEFVAVCRRKLGMKWEEIEEASAAIRVLCDAPIPTTVETHDSAIQIAQRYKFHIYDALIVAAAVSAGCATLYSEDMQDGQKIGKLTIRNPFAAGRHS